MFVRFRRQGRRHEARVRACRRALGSVDTDLEVRDRDASWAKLPGRFASLSNRVGPDNCPKLDAVISVRTPDDQLAVQMENAEDDEVSGT